MRIDRMKLAMRMAQKDMTVKALASKTGLSCATVTAVKTGKSCTPITAEKIATGLGVGISEIIEEV